MRLVSFQPDIPQNLGALMRLSVCLGVPLHVVEPCGFPFSARAVKKAAMDYERDAELIPHVNWARFEAERPPGRLIMLTTAGDEAPWDINWRKGDFLLLGRESAGAPDYVHAAADRRVAIPMPGGGRSLNVAMAAGMAAAEALRQGAVGDAA